MGLKNKKNNRLRLASSRYVLISLLTTQFYCFDVWASDLPAVDCIVQPHKVIDLGSPVAGVIEEILVDRSDFVRVGQAVARLDNRVEVATVELAEARTRLEAQLESEVINVEYDRRSQERIDSLYGRKVIPIDNKEEADRDARLSRLRLEQVHDLQRVRDLELARARELVDQKTIRSTIDGFVVDRYKSAGEFVEDQPVLRIVQLDPLNVEAIVPMQFFGVIREGMRAEVNPELADSPLRSATVTAVDPVGDAASGSFGVRLEMDNPGFKIPAGLKCEVRFVNTPESELAEAGRKRQEALLAYSAEQDSRARSTQSDVEVGMSPEYQKEESEAVDGNEMRTLPGERSLPRTYGPFEQRAQLEVARDSLNYLTHTIRSEKVLETLNYIVLIKADDRAAVENQLLDAGVTDFLYMNKPPYAGHYSLGIFDRKEVAERFVNSLRRRGLETYARERQQEKTLWWLDVEGGSGERASATYEANGQRVLSRRSDPG